MEMPQFCALQNSESDRVPDPIAEAFSRLSMKEVRSLLERPDPWAIQYQYQHQHPHFIPQMLGVGAEVTMVAPILIKEDAAEVPIPIPQELPGVSRAA